MSQYHYIAAAGHTRCFFMWQLCSLSWPMLNTALTFHHTRSIIQVVAFSLFVPLSSRTCHRGRPWLPSLIAVLSCQGLPPCCRGSLSSPFCLCSNAAGCHTPGHGTAGWGCSPRLGQSFLEPGITLHIEIHYWKLPFYLVPVKAIICSVPWKDHFHHFSVDSFHNNVIIAFKTSSMSLWLCFYGASLWTS